MVYMLIDLSCCLRFSKSMSSSGTWMRSQQIWVPAVLARLYRIASPSSRRMPPVALLDPMSLLQQQPPLNAAVLQPMAPLLLPRRVATRPRAAKRSRRNLRMMMVKTSMLSSLLATTAPPWGSSALTLTTVTTATTTMMVTAFPLPR